jgi:hypothetical protein
MWLVPITLILAFSAGVIVWSLWGVPGAFVAALAALLVDWRLARRA